jgi:VIT1/CCC1 family predicted Fe2+/Mn2+ transporter
LDRKPVFGDSFPPSFGIEAHSLIALLPCSSYCHVRSMPSEDTPLVAGSAARDAFQSADAKKSRQYHDAKSASEDGHQTEGGMLKPIIFGGLDGILTSFAIVAGAAGGELSPQVVLILGVSNIFADALSMGVGEFLSSKANNEWILSERAREEWELENYPEGEIKEMVEIFEDKVMSHEDAVSCINTMAKYKDFFVDIMMQQELELQVPDKDHIRESMKEGVVMFCSFAFFGALPLLGYVLFPLEFHDMSEGELFVSACIVTGMVLFFMGSVKSFFSNQQWFIAGMETLLLGGACATVAFTIGQLVKSVYGDDADLV